MRCRGMDCALEPRPLCSYVAAADRFCAFLSYADVGKAGKVCPRLTIKGAVHCYVEQAHECLIRQKERW